MKIGISPNLMTSMFATIFKSKLGCEVVFYPVSKLPEAVKNREIDMALIPPLDLHNAGDLAVSSSYGIVADSLFSNSFLYFKPGETEVNNITMKGDISFHDITLLKIIFKELYNTNPELVAYDGEITKITNLYIAGDENYLTGRYDTGMNITEEAVECLQSPFISYILVSSQEEILESVHAKIKQMNEDLYEFGEDYLALSGMPEETLTVLQYGIRNISFELTEELLESLKTMMALPYYYTLAEDIPEYTLV